VYQKVHVLDDTLKVKSVWSKKGAPGCSREEVQSGLQLLTYSMDQSPS